MRLQIIKFIFGISIFLIVLRLGFWQVIMADELAAKGEGQRTLKSEIIAPRGTIRFSDGSLLASTQPSYLLFVQPKEIELKFEKAEVISASEYKKNFAKKLSEFLANQDFEIEKESILQASPSATLEDLDKKKEEFAKAWETTILEKLNNNLYWVSLSKIVTHDVKKQLEKLELFGLGFEPTSQRFYPEASSSAHLLGFMGSDIYGVETGYFGLEGFYNGELKGKKGKLTQEKDALGVPILIGKFESQLPKEGKTLVTNIDRTIQHIVEEKLMKGLEKYKAKSASAIVMDPKTGAILAMASFPSYDPGQVLRYPKENFKNPIVADAYEPGSTFKVLVMAAALNENLVKPDTICDMCAGPVEMGGFTIRTWNNKYQENASMSDVIVHSDNTGMVFISKKLGIEKMFDYITKFGFGSRTGIDLQDESSPDLRPVKEWKEIDLATSSFGQGISATALQVVRGVGAIANGGKVMEPHVVSEILDGDSKLPIMPRILNEPISSESAKMVKEMMVQAVDKGEAQFYKKKSGVENFKIAGKTGTAQIPVAGHYDATKTIASFVGFAPADDPKFVMLVRYQEPGSSIFGADTAAPTFFEIAKEIFVYLGVAPGE